MFEWLFGRPSRKRLLGELAAAAATVSPGASVAPRSDWAALRITSADGLVAELEVASALEEYAALPRGQRAAWALRRVAELLRGAAERAAAEEASLSVLRPRFITTAGLQAKLLQVLPRLEVKGAFTGRLPLERVKGRIAARPLCGALHVAIVEDLPTAVAFVLESEPAAARFSSRLERAVANLRASSRQPFQQVEPGVFSGETKDQHGAAALLLEDVVRSLPVVGEPVAFVPCCELCLVTGSDDTQGLERALRRARAIYESGRVRPLSADALVLAKDGWRPWVPTAKHPLAPALSTFHELHRAEEYALQGELLSRTSLPAPADRVYFSSERNRDPGPGSAPSATLWEEGGELLLAEADFVGFMPSKGTPSFVRWLAAVEVLGGKMQRVEGLVPARFYVRAFPSPSELHLMSSLSAAMSSTVQN